MLIPINVDVPMTRLPITNWVLIGLICCTFFLGAASPGVVEALSGIEYPTGPDPVLVGDLEQLSEEELRVAVEEVVARAIAFDPEPVFDPPWWKLPILAVTSTLLHGDLLHLVGNMLFLWVFGNAVNYKFGHLGYLALFVLAALVSGIAFYCTMPGAALVGASGAIMGIVGAYLVFFPRNDVTMAYFVWIGVWGTFSLSSWIMVMFWFGFDLLYWTVGAQTGVAYVSHVTGFLVGLAIAWLLAWCQILIPTRYEQTLLDVLGIR
jgi:membrane associated rhomboid family serine protease